MNNYYKFIGKDKKTAYVLLAIAGFFGLHRLYMEDEETCAVQLLAFAVAVIMLSWEGYAVVLGMGMMFGLGMWMALDAIWLNDAFSDDVMTGHPVKY